MGGFGKKLLIRLTSSGGKYIAVVVT